MYNFFLLLTTLCLQSNCAQPITAVQLFVDPCNTSYLFNMTYLKLKYFQLSVTYFVLTGSLFEHSRRSPSTAQVGQNDLSIGYFFISSSCCGNLRVLEFCPLMTTWSGASEWLPYNAFLTCRNKLSRCGYKFFRREKVISLIKYAHRFVEWFLFNILINKYGLRRNI